MSYADPRAGQHYNKELPNKLDSKLGNSSKKFVKSETEKAKISAAAAPMLVSITASHVVGELWESSTGKKQIDNDNSQLGDLDQLKDRPDEYNKDKKKGEETVEKIIDGIINNVVQKSEGQKKKRKKKN